jgi:sulfur-oxidizing protein SoxY
MVNLHRRHASTLIALGTLGALRATAATAPPRNYAPTDDPQTIAIWLKVRASLFGDRPIAEAPPGMLLLEAPARAIDAAVVPLAIRSRFPQTSARHVSRLYLFIDANPSPISGIFQFSPASGRAEIETRVRVDAYSYVRAVAELNDGTLYGTTQFVKASGGCSAPAGSDPKAALASLGQLRFRVDGNPQGSEPVPVQLVINHPNHSGMAMDQLTRQFTPAHFVRKVEVSYGGKPVFAADVDFSISENPNFRFFVLPAGADGGELRATVVDSLERSFAATYPLRATP